MSYYIVPIVRHGLLPLWREFWNSEMPDDRFRAVNKDGALGRSTIIKAKNRKEAKRIAEAEHPKDAAIYDAISKIER